MNIFEFEAKKKFPILIKMGTFFPFLYGFNNMSLFLKSMATVHVAILNLKSHKNRPLGPT